MPKSNVIVTPESGGGPQVLFPAEAVLATSHSSGWSSVEAERLNLSLETPEHHHDAHFLTLHLGTPARIEWKEKGRHFTARVTPGEFTLIGADMPHEVRYEDADVLAISLSQKLVSRTAQEILGSGPAERLEFVPQNGTMDRQVERIGLLLKSEMESGGLAGRLFGESLGQALAAHLIAHYASVAAPNATAESGYRLSTRQLHQALDFIEANLAEDISLTEIAQAAGLSAYHFARQFKATVGLAPHAFLIERRVERAKELLAHTKQPIAEIAAAVGFAHQSHLTRHFRRLVGVTPARYR